MKEVKRKDEIVLDKYYVLREDALYELNMWDVKIGEFYCMLSNGIDGTSMYKGMRGDSESVFYALDPIVSSVNISAINQRVVKSYLRGVKEFIEISKYLTYSN